MNVMLDFISMVFAELWEMESKRKVQNENNIYVPPPGIEPVISCFPVRHSNHLAIETVNDRLLKLWQ